MSFRKKRKPNPRNKILIATAFVILLILMIVSFPPARNLTEIVLFS